MAISFELNRRVARDGYIIVPRAREILTLKAATAPIEPRSRFGAYTAAPRAVAPHAAPIARTALEWPFRIASIDSDEMTSWVDTVEKVFSGWGPKFYRAADAFHAQQSEGLRRFSEKRPWSFVSTLRRIAVVELPQNQIWRDFWGRSIFDFFNSIGQTRPRQHWTGAAERLLKADTITTSPRDRFDMRYLAPRESDPRKKVNRCSTHLNSPANKRCFHGLG
jgi:hypothetical protein